jgi:hypothetical protein
MRSALLLLVVLLTSCSAEQRLQRLLARHPELTRVDTLVVHDTIVLPGDTLIRTIPLRTFDTIRVENERQVIEVVRIRTGSPCDTAEIKLHLMGVIKPDTVYREVQVPIDRIVPCPDEMVSEWWRTVAVTLFLVLLSLIMLYSYTERP